MFLSIIKTDGGVACGTDHSTHVQQDCSLCYLEAPPKRQTAVEYDDNKAIQGRCIRFEQHSHPMIYRAPDCPTMDQPFRREFQFIDTQDKSGRKKSRRHVTKEFYRERRWKQVHETRSRDNSTEPPDLPPKPDFVVSVSKLDMKKRSNHKSLEEAPLSRFSVVKSELANADTTSIPELLRFGQSSLAKVSITTFLGAGRIDPFQTYPVNADRVVHQLVDHYIYVVPGMLHRRWGYSIKHPLPIRDLFEVYRQDASAFLGMLHHAAHHLAKTKGLNESPQTIEYKYRTIQLVIKKISESKGPYDDHTIVAVGLLANAERIWGDTEVARMHWGAVKRMIADRGGFPAFKHNHHLHTKLVWSFIALSGAWPVGNPGYIDSFAESAAIHQDSLGPLSSSPFTRSCEEFVKFFTMRRANALRALPTSENDREHHRNYPLRSTCFRPGTRMFRALAAVDRSFSRPDRRRAVDNCRVACLIYLNLVLHEYGDFSPQTERFFKEFSCFVDDDDLDCSLSAEHLLWSLIRGIEPQPTYERVWQLSRSIGVIKCTDEQTWWECEDALRMFLIMPEDGVELMVRITSWDTERFRQEILSFPEIELSQQEQWLADTFLPETRDVQWFPNTKAGVESGVAPHPGYLSGNEELVRVESAGRHGGSHFPFWPSHRETTTAQPLLRR